MTGALSNLWLGDKLGRRKTIVLGGEWGWLLSHSLRLSHTEHTCFWFKRHRHDYRSDSANRVYQLRDAGCGSYYYWPRKRSQRMAFETILLVVELQSLLDRRQRFLRIMPSALLLVDAERTS